MPAAPSTFALLESAILHKVNGALSNKAAVSLSWTVNEPGAQHRIEKQLGSGAWSLALIATPGVAAATVTKLNLAATYNFRIRSEDSGESAWVTGVSANTGALAVTGTPPAAPTGFAVGSITGYGATATWEDASDNEAYFEVEVRRGTSELHRYLVEGLLETAALNLSGFFPSSPNSIFTARVRSIGGKGTASVLPAIASDWSDEVTFETGAPSVNITSASAATAEQGQAFSYRITTNTTCTGWTADSDPGTGGEQLPAGLSRTDDVISGTATAAVGSYVIALTATDGATTGSRTLVLKVIAPTLRITSAATARASLGVAFSFQLRAVRIGTTPPLVWSLENAPAWLAVNGATGLLTGTPSEEGEVGVTTIVTDGTRTVDALLTITVPAITITSAAAITIFAGEPTPLTLTATSTAATWELSEDAPDWATLDGAVLTLTAPAEGVFEVDVIASVGEDSDSQTIVVTARPLIEVAPVISGWEGDPIIEVLRYNGTCTVAHWFLVGAPDGVKIDALSCPGPYEGSSNIVAITGTPTQSGAFAASIIAQTCCSGVPHLFRRALSFLVDGALYLSWLHADETLYDLQFQVRGSLTNRTVQSWYQRPAVEAASSDVTTTQGTSATNLQVITSKRTQAAVSGDLLTVKRGDKLRLALLLRDGRTVLDTEAGVTEVSIAFRLLDSSDVEFLFALDAVATTIGEHEYFLVETEVASAFLTDLMGDDGILAAPVDVACEIRGKIDGDRVSSATFIVRIAEDLRPS